MENMFRGHGKMLRLLFFTHVVIHNLFKGTVHPKTHIFPLTFSTVNQSRLFWCDLPRSGDICLFSNIMGLSCALNLELTAPKNTFKNSWACKQTVKKQQFGSANMTFRCTLKPHVFEGQFLATKINNSLPSGGM